MRRLFGEEVLRLRYYWFLETDLDGIPVVVTRTGWSGEVGYEIYLRDGSRGIELRDRVMAAGRDLGITPTGPAGWRVCDSWLFRTMGRWQDLFRPN